MPVVHKAEAMNPLNARTFERLNVCLQGAIAALKLQGEDGAAGVSTDAECELMQLARELGEGDFATRFGSMACALADALPGAESPQRVALRGAAALLVNRPADLRAATNAVLGQLEENAGNCDHDHSPEGWMLSATLAVIAHESRAGRN